MSRGFKITLGILVGVILIFPPVFGELTVIRSNCGGNNAARYVCHSTGLHMLVRAHLSTNGCFRLDDMSSGDQAALAKLASSHWIPGAVFMVKRTFALNGDGRAILVVCATPYRNVPQRRFFKAPPAHAVLYSDNEVGLISVEEFARLDLADFVDTRSLGPETTQRRPHDETK